MDPQFETTRFRVDGMDCASCGAKVDTATRRVAGVADVSVSVVNQTMTVKHAPGADLAEISTKVGNLGYPTRIMGAQATGKSETEHAGGVQMHGDHDQVDNGPWWRTRKAMLTAACGAALVAAYLIGQFLPEIGHWSFLVALLVGLVPIGRRAVAGALAGTPFSIETLMSIAAIGAVFIGATEEAATVVLLFLVGELLEGVAASRARASIKGLADLVPKTALPSLILGQERLTSKPAMPGTPSNRRATSTYSSMVLPQMFTITGTSYRRRNGMYWATKPATPGPGRPMALMRPAVTSTVRGVPLPLVGCRQMPFTTRAPS